QRCRWLQHFEREHDQTHAHRDFAQCRLCLDIDPMRCLEAPIYRKGYHLDDCGQADQGQRCLTFSIEVWRHVEPLPPCRYHDAHDESSCECDGDGQDHTRSEEVPEGYEVGSCAELGYFLAHPGCNCDLDECDETHYAHCYRNEAPALRTKVSN